MSAPICAAGSNSFAKIAIRFPRGMVKQMVDMYSLARDQDGNRVLDGRQWRGYR